MKIRILQDSQSFQPIMQPHFSSEALNLEDSWLVLSDIAAHILRYIHKNL